MSGEMSYGSSEYSEAAEVLFAAYVGRRSAGEEVDFEALCAEHEALADELYGLHTDWDNVSSLLGRLEAREPVGEVSEVEVEPAEVPSPDPTSSSRGWKWGAVGGLVLALGAAGLSVMLFRDKDVLAREKRTLVVERAGLLEERRELEEQGSLLSLELEAERAEAERAREAARVATERSALLSARLDVRALLAEESRLRPIDPESLPAMEAWLARADALRERLEPIPPTDPILAADLAAIEEVGGARERIGARVALLRRVTAETTEADALAWADAVEEIADPVRHPRYAGLELEPHFALVPLGREPWSGWWLFADRRTGRLPERDGDGVLQLDEGGALVLLLHPGSAEEGVAPFLVATADLTKGHWERAGLAPDRSELGYAAPTPAQAELVGTSTLPVLPAPRRADHDSR